MRDKTYAILLPIMKLKLQDIFDNSHLMPYSERIRSHVWRDTCDYVYDEVNQDVATDIHSNIFMMCFHINDNKNIIRDEFVMKFQILFIILFLTYA